MLGLQEAHAHENTQIDASPSLFAVLTAMQSDRLDRTTKQDAWRREILEERFTCPSNRPFSKLCGSCPTSKKKSSVTPIACGNEGVP